jgi:S-DNA-T family DNA segregation ATPase FtsK/SpoIIIE
MLRRQLSAGRPVPRLRFRGPNLHVPLWLLGAGWALLAGARALWWLVVHPRTALALAGAVLLWAVWLRWGWAPFGWTSSSAAVVLGVWWARFPESFGRHVTDRVHAGWRRLSVYRREWQPAMVTCGLAHAPALGSSLPRLRRVRIDGDTDVVRVRMLEGQTPEQWRAAGPQLARVFEVRTIRVRTVPNRLRELDLLCRRRGTARALNRHVTEPEPVEDTQPATPAQGAFPRQPRGGA